MPDKPTRRAIDAALDAVPGGLGGEVIRDAIGPAVYRLEPSPMSVVACAACQYVSLIPSVPRVPELIWSCPRCGRAWELQPPARVWVAGSAPTLVPSVRVM